MSKILDIDYRTGSFLGLNTFTSVVTSGAKLIRTPYGLGAISLGTSFNYAPLATINTFCYHLAVVILKSRCNSPTPRYTLFQESRLPGGGGYSLYMDTTNITAYSLSSGSKAHGLIFKGYTLACITWVFNTDKGSLSLNGRDLGSITQSVYPYVGYTHNLYMLNDVVGTNNSAAVLRMIKYDTPYPDISNSQFYNNGI